MAEIQLHAVLEKFKGKMGDVVFKKRGNTLYVSRRPDFSKRKLSAAQKQSLARFREAVKHARRIMANPEALKPFVKIAQKTGKTVYNTIIADYLKKPK